MLPELTGADAAAVLPANGFAVWVRPRLDDGAITETLTANAFYVAHYDVFGLVGIDPIEKLPVGAVLTVLSHEFGHHLFHRSFGRADGECVPDNTAPDAPGRFESEAAIRGFNEGFADLVGYAVTGATNPVGDAFPDVLAGDRMIDVRLPGSVAFAFFGEQCNGDFYCHGTLFTRSLYEAAVARGEDINERATRMAIARDVFQALAAMPGALRERIDAGQSSAGCVANPNIDAHLVAVFLDEMVKRLPEATRPSVCERFVANFRTTGYTPEERSACP